MGVNKNKEEQSFERYENNKNEDKGEDIGYILFPFVDSSFPPPNKSNCLTHMGKKSKSLTYFMYIPKIG